MKLPGSHKCPPDCPHYESEANDYFYEWCELTDGKYTLEIKDGEFVKCPLGKW